MSMEDVWSLVLGPDKRASTFLEIVFLPPTHRNSSFLSLTLLLASARAFSLSLVLRSWLTCGLELDVQWKGWVTSASLGSTLAASLYSQASL